MSEDTKAESLKELLMDRFASIEKIIESNDRRYEERFKATDEKTTLALAASEKAVTKAEVATEKRFDAVNEFRGTLSDQAATLFPRAEAESRFNSFDEKIEDLKKDIGSLKESRSNLEGRIWMLGGVISVAIIILNLIMKYLR